MAKYNFDKIIDRHNTFSDKWDIVKDKDVIPLWVADMDFKVAPPIQKAVEDLAKHGVYGYGIVPDEYYKAICSFHKRHYNCDISEDSIIPTPCIVGAISAILQGLAQCSDEVIVQTPAYNNFFSCIKNSGCQIVENKIIYSDGIFSLDFDSLEKQSQSEKAKFLLLCNPHNPTGRLWTKQELERILEICKKNNLIVIADEVHCDIRPNNSVFTSFLNIDKSYNDRIILVRSASKTFNTAGLKNAYIVCQNKEFFKRIDRQVNINEICDVTSFGVAATIAAYTQCDDWLLELNDYIQENYRILCAFMKENYPEFKVAKLESTYLAWIDMSKLNMSSEKIKNVLLKKAKVLINDGDMYRSPNEGFIRINLGCTHATLKEALSRFKKAL